MEQKPQFTLHDLLEDCETLREERASVRVSVGVQHTQSDIVKELSHTNPDRIE
jgi:hypothetical protein